MRCGMKWRDLKILRHTTLTFRQSSGSWSMIWSKETNKKCRGVCFTPTFVYYRFVYGSTGLLLSVYSMLQARPWSCGQPFRELHHVQGRDIFSGQSLQDVQQNTCVFLQSLRDADQCRYWLCIHRVWQPLWSFLQERPERPGYFRRTCCTEQRIPEGQ